MRVKDQLVPFNASGMPQFIIQENLGKGKSADVQITDMIWEPYPADLTATPPSDWSWKSQDCFFSGENFHTLTMIPVKKIGEQDFVRLKSCKITYQVKALPSKTATKTWKDASVLAQGNWVKLTISSDGLYKLDANFLKKNGVPVENIDPRTMKIYGTCGGMVPEKNDLPRYDDLEELPIRLDGENDSRFDASDALYFYGESTTRFYWDSLYHRYFHQTNIYSDQSFYFLTWGGNQGKRVTSIPSSPSANKAAVSGDEFLLHEFDKRNGSKSGRVWYGDDFDKVTEALYNGKIYTPVNGEKGLMFSSVLGQTYGPQFSNFELWYRSNLLFRQSIQPRKTGIEGNFANPAFDSALIDLSDGDIQFLYRFNKNASGAIGWIDYYFLQYRRNWDMAGKNQLQFRDIRTVGQGNLTQFTLNNVPGNLSVWDVTKPDEIVERQGSFLGNQFVFTAPSNQLRTYFAFYSDAARYPDAATGIGNQNLHALEPVPYLIINPDEFFEASYRLANFRRGQGISSHVVSLAQIWNEFSGGKQDVAGLRDFIKMMYDKGLAKGVPLKNVLLMGAASYDFKNRIQNNTNFIPTYQSRESFTLYSYASDDFLGLLDDGEGQWAEFEGMDIGVGRLPVKSLEQAQEVVSKIIRYNRPESLGDWKNNVLLVADDRDYNVHMFSSESIANGIVGESKTLNIYKLYLDSYKKRLFNGVSGYPEVNEELRNQINKGMLIVNYSGHGGTTQWADERIIDVEVINQLKNADKLPFFMAATCDFGPYDDPAYESAGQRLVLNPNGGAIGILTSTRIANTGQNTPLNAAFFQNNIFKSGSQGLSLIHI